VKVVGARPGVAVGKPLDSGVVGGGLRERPACAVVHETHAKKAKREKEGGLGGKG